MNRFMSRALFLIGLLGMSCEIYAGSFAVRPTHGEPPAPKLYPRSELLVSTEALALWRAPKKETVKQAAPGTFDFLEDESGKKGAGKEKDTVEGKEGAKANEPQIPASYVLLDARRPEEFLGGHISGAFNVESDKLQDPKGKPYYLPGVDAFHEIVKRTGLTPEDRVVIYDSHGGRLAARLWFALWAYGHDRVSILNGGLRKWHEEKRGLTRDKTAAPKAGTWTPLAQPRGVCTYEGLGRFRSVNTPSDKLPLSSILDARTFEEYKGDDIRAKIGGHVPGAVNMSWDSFIRPEVPTKGGASKGYFVWLDAPKIHAALRAGGIISTQPLVVYGQSGGRASHLLFTLHLMGYTQAVNYYGGWREYGNRDDAEVER